VPSFRLTVNTGSSVAIAGSPKRISTKNALNQAEGLSFMQWIPRVEVAMMPAKCETVCALSKRTYFLSPVRWVKQSILRIRGLAPHPFPWGLFAPDQSRSVDRSAAKIL
jgi:hypothetical protein